MNVRIQMIAANKTLFVSGTIFTGLCAYMAGNIGYGAYLIFRAVVCPH